MKAQSNALIIKLPRQKKIFNLKKRRTLLPFTIWLFISPVILIIMAVLCGFLRTNLNRLFIDPILWLLSVLTLIYTLVWLLGGVVFLVKIMFKLGWSVFNRIKEGIWQFEPPEYYPNTTAVRITPHTLILEQDRNSCYKLYKLHNVRVMRPTGNHATTCVHFDYAGETPETVAVGEQLDAEQTRWFAETLQNVFAFRCHQVEQVVFGVALPPEMPPSASLLNPDVSDLQVPFWRLTRIVVVTQEYDFHLVERFVTYAVNALGQKYLKTSVNVEIYGDPAELHPNLRNSLTNLCRNVTVKDRSS